MNGGGLLTPCGTEAGSLSLTASRLKSALSAATCYLHPRLSGGSKRSCPKPETPIARRPCTSMRRSQPYHLSKEWDLTGRLRTVRFRVRRPMQSESRTVILPLALAAARGKLAPYLGTDFKRCAVLEGLRLGGASLDLLIVTRAGSVALGECKRGDSNSLRKVRNAVRQLVGYVRRIRRLKRGWLSRQLNVSYDRFDFPGFSQVLRELGLRSRKRQQRWLRRVEGCCRDGKMQIFSAVGRGGEEQVGIWVLKKAGRVQV